MATGGVIKIVQPHATSQIEAEACDGWNKTWLEICNERRSAQA